MKEEKYIRKLITKVYFTWYERLYLWFRGLFRKEPISSEAIIRDVWAERIKEESEAFIKVLNEDLIKNYGVEMKFKKSNEKN